MKVIDQLKATGFTMNTLLESHSKKELIQTVNSILERDEYYNEIVNNLDFRNNFFALVNFYLSIDIRDGKNDLLLSKKAKKRLQELYASI